MHEVDIFRKRLAQSLRHGLDTTIGNETATDLRLDLLTHPVDAVLVLVALQPLLQLGELAGLLLRGLHELFQHAVEIKITKRAVQVIGATDRTARLHAAEAGDRRLGDSPHHCLIRVEQRVVEHLGELFGGETFESSGATLLRLARHVLAVHLRFAVGVDGVLRTAQGEVHLEHRLEGAPVGGVLDQRAAEGVLERVAVLHRDDLHRLHGVEVLREADRQPGATKLHDEPVEQVDHDPTRGARRDRRCERGGTTHRRPAPCGELARVASIEAEQRSAAQ